MAYLDQRECLTSEQVTALVALSLRVDMTAGPGGSKIAPLGSLNGEGLYLLAPSWAGARVAFVALYPSRQIAAHRDPPIQGRRFHIPLVVNAGCWSFHEGEWQQLSEGHCYEMDPTQEHGAVNWGSTVRLHLMIDTES